MQIQISEDITNEQDITIIKLLEVCYPFEIDIKKIRNKFEICIEGAEKIYCNDLSSEKPVVKEALRSIQESYEKLLENKKLQGEITNLCKKYNLDDRWYSSIAEIVLFSSVNNLTDDINCWVSKNHNKNSLIGRPSITISVGGDVSRDRLIKWVRENWETYRQEAQSGSVIKKNIGIPFADFLKFDQEIIRMHERENMNPHQISLILEKRFRDSQSSWERKVNEKLIEQRLKRYKKLFNLS